ncbi:MAG: hypothetical protein VX777_10195 [Chlamydiota bacterium]|nr:hypothetical protein [Chlamydiota bacterium]
MMKLNQPLSQCDNSNGSITYNAQSGINSKIFASNETYSIASARFLEIFSFVANTLTLGLYQQRSYTRIFNSEGKVRCIAKHELVDQVFSFDKQLANDLRHNSLIQRKVVEIVHPFREKSIQPENIVKASEMLRVRCVEVKPEVKSELLYCLDKISREVNNESTGDFEYPVHFIPPSEPESRSISEWNEYTELKNQYDDYYEECNTDAEKEDKYRKELQKLEDSLSVGDIVFMHLDPDTCPLKSLLSSEHRSDAMIKFGQKIARSWLDGPCDNDSYLNTHAAIIGEHNGKKVVIEAASSEEGDEVRYYDFDASMNRITATDKFDYRIFKVKDSELSEAAAKVAKELSEYVTYDEEVNPITIEGKPLDDNVKTRAKYAKTASIASVFKNAKVDIEDVQYAFEVYARYKKGEKGKEYFCSSLVSESYMIARIDHYIKDKVEICPDFNAMESNDIKEWSKEMSVKSEEEFKKVPLFCSPSSTTPQKLRSILQKNSGLFEEKYRIKPYRKLISRSERVDKVCSNIQGLMGNITKVQSGNVDKFLYPSEKKLLSNVMTKLNNQEQIPDGIDLRKVDRIAKKIEYVIAVTKRLSAKKNATTY